MALAHVRNASLFAVGSLGSLFLAAFVACTTEVVKVDPGEPTPVVEPTDPVGEGEGDEAPPDEEPATPSADGGKPSKKDAGTTTPPKDASADAKTDATVLVDGSVSDGSTSDASAVDASSSDASSSDASMIDASTTDSGATTCGGTPCASSSVTCCGGSPYCVAPSGFSLQCSASPGFSGYRCRATSDCASSYTCQAGTCKPPCAPSCVGRICGSDGCGGSCGSCGAGQYCSAGSCITPPQDECNPVSNTGCTSPNECILLANETPKCALLGTGTQGSFCSASTPCDGGYACFGGTCRKVCTLGSDAACPGTTTCKAVSGWVEHGACG